MEIKSIFLGDKGLSSSEANHVANTIKEVCERLNTELNQVGMMNSHIHLTTGTHPYRVATKMTDLPSKLLRDGLLYALSAWLREGIKAKNALNLAVINATYRDFDIEAPKAEGTLMPMISGKTDTQLILENFSIKEYADYLALEAKAAHIGKKIHGSQSLLHKWRDAIVNFKPIEFVTQRGPEYVVENKLVYTLEEMDAVYFMMQKEHRENEKKLNYYKAKLENLRTADSIRVTEENRKANANNLAYQRDIAAAHGVANSELEKKIKETCKVVSELKVIIPEEFAETLRYIQTEFSSK